jgi:hypothetical protein
MPMAAARLMVARLQPRSLSQGRISTPGAPRTPAETSKQRKMTPTTTKA